jgi:hypothetical protein
MQHMQWSDAPIIATVNDSPVTDEEKHAWCLRRTGYRAGYLAPLTYAKAERDGQDMRYYVIWRAP